MEEKENSYDRLKFLHGKKIAFCVDDASMPQRWWEEFLKLTDNKIAITKIDDPFQLDEICQAARQDAIVIAQDYVLSRGFAEKDIEYLVSVYRVAVMILAKESTPSPANCMMIYEHRSFSVHKMLFRLAMCVSMSEFLLKGKPQTAQNKRMLVVDDTQSYLLMYQYLFGYGFSKYNITLEKAKSGVEALELCRANRPDIIVTDISMPAMDGIELLEELRKDPALRSICVIMLTARPVYDEGIKCLQLGALDYINKPFERHDILSVVRNVFTMQGTLESELQ